MTEKKKDTMLTTGSDSSKTVECLHQGLSRRDTLRMLGILGLAALGADRFLGSAGQVLAAEVPDGEGIGKSGGRIRIAAVSSSTADTLDPAKGSLSTDYVRQYMCYNGLTRFDNKLVPQMELAERIETSDSTVWTITLRKDVTFHNGKSLDPADVVFSLLRHKDPATGSKLMALMSQLAEVKATGPFELQIRLSAPNVELPSILAVSHLLIVPAGTTDFGLGIGTGPFKVQEFKPGIRSLMVRNSQYWKAGLPYLDEIECIAIGDEPSRVNALLAGDIQVITGVNPRSTNRIMSSTKYRVIDSPSGNYTDVIIRQDQMPGKSPEFTQAIKHLLDRERIKSAVFRGYASIGNDQPIAPGARYYNKDLPQTVYDPQKAVYLLKKAGLSDISLPIATSAIIPGGVDIATLLQQSAQQAGLKLSINRLPGDGYWANHWMKHPLSFGSVNPRPNADVLFTQFFQSDAPWNESGWKNAQFDQMLVLARAESNEVKRHQLYADMQTLVNQEGGVGIPVFISNIDAIDQRIKGYGGNPLGGFMGYMFAEQVWLDNYQV